MITATGYSKDKSIVPEGIVITFGQSMIQENGGMKTFFTTFNDIMSSYEDCHYWMHKQKFAPKFDILHVYIIVSGRLYGRVNYGGWHTDQKTAYRTDGKIVEVNWPYIVLAGPLDRCPHKRNLKGFQGFRYCTKLF